MKNFNPPGGPEDTPARRPLQRVLDFLNQQIDQGKGLSQRLPTIRDIAARLGVSPRTVQKAFHEVARQGKIQSVTGRGSFTVPPGRGPAFPHLRIGLNIELDHYEPVNAWAYAIHGAILQAALASGHNAVFTGAEEELRRKGETQVDGFILLPDSTDLREKLHRTWPKAPAVFLNPPIVAATANFVSPDYNGLGFTLGKTWRECGKKRIAFVQNPPLEASPSGQLFLSGLISGLGSRYNVLDSLYLVCATSFTVEAGHEAVRNLLEKESKRPDAIFCKGDFLALGALHALREAGCDVPGEVSLVGGSGLDLSESEWPQLTRSRQPFQQLGEALFDMLVKRLEQQGAPIPGRFLPVTFIGGATTSTEENAILFRSDSSPTAYAGAAQK